MPEPKKELTSQESVEVIKNDLLALYNQKFANLEVSEKKEPVLFQIKTALSTDEGREKLDDISKMCFGYLLDNKSSAYSKTKRDIFDSILNALGIIDNGLAKYIEDMVNKDKVMTSRTEHKKETGIEPVNVLVLYDETKTAGHSSKERPIADGDPRIENLKELLKRFKSKEVDPWYHKNSEQFDSMVKSIEHAIEYSNALEKGNGNKAVLDKMLTDVRNNTLDYVLTTSDTPDRKYGESRLNLAIASLLSVDREKGLETIDMVATKRLIRLEHDRDHFLKRMGEDPTKTRFSKSTFMSLDKIIKETGYRDFANREDMSEAAYEKIEQIKKEAYDPRYGMSEEGLARYVVLQTISDMVTKMTGSELFKLEISNEDLDKQCSNIMASESFFKVNVKFFDSDPVKNINLKDFHMAFKVQIMEDRKAEKNNPSAAYTASNAQKNFESPKKNVGAPQAKTLKDTYDEMKEFLNLGKDATYDEINKAIKKGFREHHPDKHTGDSPEERAKHEAISQKLGDYKNTLNEKEKEFRNLDNLPKVSVPKNEVPSTKSAARHL